MGGYTNRALRNYQGQFQGAGFPASFYAALVIAEQVGTLDNAAAADQGGDVVRIPITGHGMTAGRSLTISGSTNYNGNHVILAVPDVNNVDILANYVAETFAGTEVCYQGPGPDSNTFSDHTEIATGNGYDPGGIALALNTTNFTGLSENDASDLAEVALRALSWTASGGTLPASGNGAAFLILTDPNATQSAREIWAYFDMGGQRQVSDGQALSTAGGGKMILQRPRQLA